MWWQRRPISLWAIAVGGSALVVLAHRTLPEPISSILAALLFISTIVSAAILGGWKFGGAATFLALLSAWLFFSPPYYVRVAENPMELVRLSAYLVLGVILSLICDSLNRAWAQNEERRRQLEVEVEERCKAQLAEQTRAEELLTTLSSIGDGVITTDAEGRIVYLNPVAEELTGWLTAEAKGQPLDEVFCVLDEQTGARVHHPAPRAVLDDRGMEVPVPSVLICKDGSERIIANNASPIRGADGRLTGCVLTFRDVTCQKNAADALRLSEQRFTGFMEHLPGLAWIKDLEGRYVFANQAAEKTFQKLRSELYGKTDAEIFDPETAQRFQENDRAALDSGNGIQVIEVLRDPAGTLRYSIVSKFPIHGSAASSALVGGIAIDVTDRLQIEQQLRRHKERLELAQRAGRIGTFEWNTHTDEVEWSESEEEIYGLEAKGFRGRLEHWLEAVHPDDRAAALQECQAAVRERKPFDTEFRIVRPDGQVRWIAAQGKVVCDEQGRPQRMVGVNLDITERRDAERALRDADRQKDEFLAILAHELRNPLAPLRSGLEVLQRSANGTPESQVIHDMMDRQLTHMVRIVDDLLDVSRIARQKLVLRSTRVLLRDIIDSAVETVRPAVFQSDQTLQVEIPDAPLELWGDFTRLAQVFGNLLSNSSKYTPFGGSIMLSATLDAGHAVVVVRDTGVGIPAEALPRIFAMFSQVDGSLERSTSGLGIGLALVKSLVELHGGTVCARSGGAGLGSEFEVRLPCKVAESPASTRSAPLSNVAAPARRRVLVADDNRDASTSLAMILALSGHETQTAHDGLEALKIAESFHPDVALLDIGMPRLNGYETARRLRSAAWGKGIRLIAVTGWGQEHDREESRRAGFDHHLVKPVDSAALLKLLDERMAESELHPVCTG